MIHDASCFKPWQVLAMLGFCISSSPVSPFSPCQFIMTVVEQEGGIKPAELKKWAVAYRLSFKACQRVI